ncbi:Hypothetical protein RG540_CH13700 [Neorhizobium galegae bv. orientalis str. HAMBI 540]|uniref:Uncharacterized protein n=1 Tax=Neorhizobium galegae bv. orientalis str. HAMBI 540 TaxID=1028800 RepID=A0A068SR51_NEOGA|nr:Hypothetical protein RG540_CH13700 [Neorhizobium galegae bv. orientalis str. HAMBI 540]
MKGDRRPPLVRLPIVSLDAIMTMIVTSYAQALAGAVGRGELTTAEAADIIDHANVLMLEGVHKLPKG